MARKSATTEVMLERELILYRRERSSVWQCRYKVGGVWQRTSTHQRDLRRAKERAKELLIEASYRLRNNLPPVTRKFRDVARLAIKRMEAEEQAGKGKTSYADYKRIINDYLVPCLGKHSIANIDYAALDALDVSRTERMGKAPSKSTLLMHNAALNRVFDEAVIHGFLHSAAKPQLISKDKGRVGSNRRAAFTLEEVKAMLAGFNSWIDDGRNAHAREVRELMRDYVVVLLDTGARPGKELLNLRWQQINTQIAPSIKLTGERQIIDGVEEDVSVVNSNRSATMHVSGKTGARWIVGRQDTVNALKRIAMRNYDNLETPVLFPLKNVARADNKDFVFRLKDKTDVRSTFQHMFENYLKEHNLLIDPVTAQKRVLYSLRHTYATFMLMYDRTNPATLVKQMGTSLEMLQKHYSHLDVTKAIDQLRGEEMRQLINEGTKIDEMYRSNKGKSKYKVTTHPTANHRWT